LFKEIIKQAKEEKDTRGDKPISYDIFTKIRKLALCQTEKIDPEKFEHCVNPYIIKR